LSTDDRFEEIKRLLDSTVSEFQSLFESAGGFEDSRVGNGWVPEKVGQQTFLLQPRPLPELTTIAEGRKCSLFRNRFFSFLKPPQDEVHLMGEPSLKLIPFWMVKGFHECFYFRGNSYKIDIPEDVVAVEVEGKIRDLMGRGSGDSQGMSALTRRLLGKREWSGAKSFHLNDATELAYMYKEGLFFVNSDGKEDLEAEAFFEGGLPLQEMSHQEIARQYPGSNFAPSLMSKEELVRKLHTSIVKPPVTFTKILSNRFQITILAEYLMPVFTFIYVWRGERKGLSVHGFTGGISQ
jgi:hypothetical protein